MLMANKENLMIALLANKANEHGKLGHGFAFLLRQMNRVLFCCDIGIGAQIDPSCIFHHSGLGCVIHSDAVVGKNCRFFQHVTIGSAWRGGSLLESMCRGLATTCCWDVVAFCLGISRSVTAPRSALTRW